LFRHTGRDGNQLEENMSENHTDFLTTEINNQAAQERQEFNLFAMLKPSIQRDGNQWCVLYGKDLQEGIAGFGDSPHHAVLDFNHQWYQSVKS